MEKDKVTLQEGETSDYRWITAEELLNMEDDQLIHPHVKQYIKGE